MWNQEMSENKVDFLNKLFYLTYLKNLENVQNTEYRENDTNQNSGRGWGLMRIGTQLTDCYRGGDAFIVKSRIRGKSATSRCTLFQGKRLKKRTKCTAFI